MASVAASVQAAYDFIACDFCGTRTFTPITHDCVCGRTSTFCTHYCCFKAYVAHEPSCKSFMIRMIVQESIPAAESCKSVDAVRLAPSEVKADFKLFEITAFPNLSEVHTEAVFELPLTKALGLPLRMLETSKLGLQVTDTAPNSNAVLLSMNTDSGAFRDTVIGNRQIYGDVILYRADGQKLDLVHVEALVGYFYRHLGPVFRIANKGTEAEQARSIGIAATVLTPNSFAVDFEVQKRNNIQEGKNPTAWMSAECPVQKQRTVLSP